jgi:starch synthase
MYIVMVSAECAPVAKVGGLADVVFGLTRELEIRGNDVHIVLPKYDCMRYDHIWGLQVSYRDLQVPWYGGAISCDVWFGFVHGRKCFFIEPHSEDRFFERGRFYGFYDDPSRFAFFSRAALEFLYKDGRRPDIIHCHDWQTGLVPVLLYEVYAGLGMGAQRVCYTIHNFKHQGVTGEYILHAAGLPHPHGLMAPERLLDNFNPTEVNLMKGGVVYSNFVTTVSPNHAREVLETDQSYGLGHTLNLHRDKFGGVLNGLDYDVWNPQIDPLIPSPYAADSVEGKYSNKDALRHRLLLRREYKPIVAYVGRLDAQKGVHLIRHGLHYSLRRGAQFVLLGSSSDDDIAREFWHLKHHFNDNPDCHLEIGFDEELSHLIYAGADLILMPSMFEPCGLAQLIGLKYGSVPVVRAVGGLVDTVFDKDYSYRPEGERNGFVFDHPDEAGLEFALGRAIDLWHHAPQEFRRLMLQGMAWDYSWARPGQDYQNIYNFIRHPV